MGSYDVMEGGAWPTLGGTRRYRAVLGDLVTTSPGWAERGKGELF